MQAFVLWDCRQLIVCDREEVLFSSSMKSFVCVNMMTFYSFYQTKLYLFTVCGLHFYLLDTGHLYINFRLYLLCALSSSYEITFFYLHYTWLLNLSLWLRQSWLRFNPTRYKADVFSPLSHHLWLITPFCWQVTHYIIIRVWEARKRRPCLLWKWKQCFESNSLVTFMGEPTGQIVLFWRADTFIVLSIKF